MRRTVRLVIALCALAAFTAPAAMAAERMWVGFHDDPSFRWVPDRGGRIQAASREGATIMRLLVQWNLAAPTRPSSPANPFDPAYKFDDIDEALRSAQETDMEVMLTISGTPRWANGGRNPNVIPRRMADFTAFARAIATRYSGRFNGYPFVRFYSVWNEPNLNLFLTPQFNCAGKSVAPANYAKLYAAAYAGIKAGNSMAKIGIGETSARGRDRRVPGVSDTHSPGKVRRARGEGQSAAQVRRLDASPVPVQPELQAVPGREVAERLARLASPLQCRAEEVVQPQDGAHLGHRVRSPDEAGGHVRRSVLDAGRIHPAVDGDREEVPVRRNVHLVRLPGRPGPAVGVRLVQGGRRAEGIVAEQVRRQREAAGCAKRRLRFKAGTTTPLVNLYTRRYCVVNTTGESIGMTWRIFRAGRLIAVGQQTSALKRDCTISARLRFRSPMVKGQTYTATFALNDRHGVNLSRKLTLHGI